MVSSRGNRGLAKTLDWHIIICYLLLILIGWVNIYASVHSDNPTSIFDWSCRSGKQFIWFITSIGLASMILFVINPRAYEGFSLLFYIMMIGLLIAVIFLGDEVKGSRSWFTFGPVRFQPAEFSKITTSLLLATVMSQLGYKITRLKDFILTALIILVPMAIIVLQSETGSALVYVGFIFMLYREGLSGWFIVLTGLCILLFILTLTSSAYTALVLLFALTSICECMYTSRMKTWLIFRLPFIVLFIFLPDLLELLMQVEAIAPFVENINPIWIVIGTIGLMIPFITYKAFRERRIFTHLATISLLAGTLLIFSTEFIFNNILQDHQRKRIEVLLGMKEDPSGVGYNVNQSMIAIGSGGAFGKGYLKGTQTAFGFVPEQSTDFIFCTIGEEWGFVGAVVLLLIYAYLIFRIIHDAERSREAFTRIYGYCVASCIFMHLFINIGMTIGLMPVIGIPLPLVSYGGSSLWGFTIMIFIFVALDRNERKYF